MSVPDIALVDKTTDLDLYSRQFYVYGASAMQRMATSRVLICGMNGLGVEIGMYFCLIFHTRHSLSLAKNVALAGVGTLTVQDSRVCSLFDMGTQYYITEADLGKNRAEVTARRLSELNPYTAVKAETGNVQSKPLTWFDNFDVTLILYFNKLIVYRLLW